MTGLGEDCPGSRSVLDRAKLEINILLRTGLIVIGVFLSVLKVTDLYQF